MSLVPVIKWFSHVFTDHRKNKRLAAERQMVDAMNLRIQELELQNQKLRDKNKALQILLDNTSRKLSALGLIPLKDKNTASLN